ncbi:hypothetical protein [Ferrigenium sp. UT5]|uniref:hypothetical protein n=1 Tax=Ferrigenium sp. UT5 TaxID=3242105 RepID=UPI00354DCA93
MKKVALSLAGVLAAATFAPEASAVPAFARQTGMACSACHAQHFPVLGSFGRAFKAAGFTMVGSQEKIEGDKISLPSTLNFGVLAKVRFQKTNGNTAKPLDNRGGTIEGADTNDGQIQFPDEYSLFFGGRVADNGMVKIGTMTEFNLVGGAGTAGLRIPVVFDLDAVKLSVIPYATDALGAFYGYSESSTGVTRGIRWAEHRKEISAHQYVGMGAGAASGVALVAKTDMGYVNISRWSPNLFLGPSSTAQTNPESTAISIAATPTVLDFDIIAGVDYLTGSGIIADNVTRKDTNAVGASFQAQGELAGLESSFYATWAKAQAGDSLYATNPGAIKAFTLGADITVIPHTLSLGAAYRGASNGKAGSNDDAITLAAVYDVAQNVALHADWTSYKDNQGANGDTLFTGMLEAAW